MSCVEAILYFVAVAYICIKKINFESSDTVDSLILSDSNQSAFDVWITIFVSIIVKRNCLHIYIYIYCPPYLSVS